MKKYRKNIIILVLVSLLIMYLIMKDNFNIIISHILDANIWFIFCGFILMLLNVFFQSLALNLYLKQIKPGYKFKDSFILMSSAMFFNAITPFSSGGQPFQMYLLKNQGIRISESGSALLQNFISYQIGLIFMGTIAIILNGIFDIIPSTSMLRRIVMIGFLVNALILILLLFFATARKANIKILNFIFGLKFMRKKETLRDKIESKIDEFYDSMLYFKKNKFILLKSILYNTLSLICLYIVPFFIFLSIGKYNILSVLDSMVCSSYTYFIGSFVPIPGGTGGLEYGFLEFFKGFLPSVLLSVCMLLWRFITYYLMMIFGAISLIFVKRGEEKCE